MNFDSYRHTKVLQKTLNQVPFDVWVRVRSESDGLSQSMGEIKCPLNVSLARHRSILTSLTIVIVKQCWGLSAFEDMGPCTT